MRCEHCNNKHDGSFGTGRFCSKVCANTFARNSDTNPQTKKGNCITCNVEIIVDKRTNLKKAKCSTCKVRVNKLVTHFCIVCNNKFQSFYKNTKFCGNTCSCRHHRIKKRLENPNFKICPTCNNEFIPITNSKYCGKKCKIKKRRGINVKAVADRRRKLKVLAVEHKGSKCVICGYGKCNRSLQFHHLEPDKKDFGVGSGVTKAWKKIKKELEKTVLLCANCHGEVHDGQIDIETLIQKEKQRTIV